jgi:teichuronic acid biosynthesis glycosyltransferase TuaH
MCLELINILLVPINDLFSHPTQTRFISLAQKMVERYDVNLFALRYANLPTDMKAHRKLNFKSLDYFDFRARSIGSYYALNAGPIFSVLLRKLKQEKIDLIIHANLLPSTIAVGLGRMLNIPLVFDYQDHFPESAATYYKGSTLRSLAYSFTYQLNEFNIKHSDEIVTVTDSHKEMIKKIVPHKPVTVIPNGVDMDLFRPIPRSVALRGLNMQHLESKKLLLYFGSIDSWLDFSTIFNVLKRLLSRGIDVILLIVGYSHSRYFLEELKKTAEKLGIRDKVLFLPPVLQNRLVYYINASDVTLAPFRPLVISEAVPLKILESLACGRPVCSTNLSEIAKRFKGVISIYSSEEELESELLEYLRGDIIVSPYQMRELVKRYSWDNFAERYYELLSKTIEKHP